MIKLKASSTTLDCNFITCRIELFATLPQSAIWSKLILSTTWSSLLRVAIPRICLICQRLDFLPVSATTSSFVQSTSYSDWMIALLFLDILSHKASFLTRYSCRWWTHYHPTTRTETPITITKHRRLPKATRTVHVIPTRQSKCLVTCKILPW